MIYKTALKLVIRLAAEKGFEDETEAGLRDPSMDNELIEDLDLESQKPLKLLRKSI